MEWWNDIKQLSKVYLTSSEQMDRSGPVPAAVRYAGYRSEDEDELEDEESVEEVEEYEDEYEPQPQYTQPHYTTAATATHHAGAAPAIPTSVTSTAPVTVLDEARHEEIPEYTAPAHDSGVQIGANGYAVEKKARAFVDDVKEDAH